MGILEKEKILEKKLGILAYFYRRPELQETIEEMAKTEIERRGYLNPAFFAHIINMYIQHHDIFIMLIQGLSGHGKTTLALHIAAEFYKTYRKNKKIKNGYTRALRYLMFDPLEIVSELIKQFRRQKPVDIIIFDDAGTWLSKWGITADKRTFLEFMNLLRTAVGAMIFTDIWSVAKYVRDISKVKVIVEKLSPSEYPRYGIKDTKREWSIGKVYLTKISIKGVYETYIGDVLFPLDLPQVVRYKYNAKRTKYTMRLAARVISRILSNDKVIQNYAKSSSGRKFLEELMNLLEEL